MDQNTIENYFDSIGDLNFTLPNIIQPSHPSEEINISNPFNTDIIPLFFEIDVDDFTLCESYQLFKDILDADTTAENNSVIEEFVLENTEIENSIEPNDVADSIQSNDEQLAMIKSTVPTLPTVRSKNEKSKTENISDQSISLSSSVAVTTSDQLQIVCPLEETYRPRYKSDYFPQNGNVRRPRYVADNEGKHHITIEMPKEYNRDFKNQYVRVALITTSMNNRGHFYSPYKFQTNHNDVKVPDENPIYLKVDANKQSDFKMKLHLVLIKSKLDKLYDEQPLKRFSDTNDGVKSILVEDKLTPKDLINKYQLEKSHIAFTLCTKFPNGSYEVHSETTIISTVLSESPTTQKTKSKEPTNVNVGKQISCPNCAHCFQLNNEQLETTVPKRKLLTKPNKKIENNISTAKKKKKI